MKGARRVVVFCLVTVVLPTILIIIPLYLRNNVFADVLFQVAESDVLEVGDDISTIFCQEHSLKMNGTFNAYQVDDKPEISNIRKHIRLKKSMRLPDDTLEYWGFFLPRGSIVQLSVCSRYDGSSILVVRGDRHMNTCGLLDRSNKKKEPEYIPYGKGFRVTRFEINSEDKASPPPLTSPPPVQNVQDSKNVTLVASNISTTDIPVTITTRADRSIDEENHGGEADGGDDDDLLNSVEETSHKRRHSRGYPHLQNQIRESADRGRRLRRSAHPAQAHNLDGKTLHGGIAANQTDDMSSASSFEAELITCYDGSILLKEEFPSSQLCYNVSFLVSNHTSRTTTTHTVTEDGYYYYIFYSDNDLVENDIFAVFDIHKPTYQYANISKNCINETLCTFPVAFLGKEIVIVEVPTRDGIEHEADDISTLVSVCHPRMAVYIIFPLLVLILILGCAFL